MHVNYLGNLLMGKVVNQAFGLPDFDVPSGIKDDWEAIQNTRY